jgi:aspartate/methionine/tyrosine aminotransferase
MSDILLSKPKLPADWLDVSVGEPYIVREKLFEVFDMSDWKLPAVDHEWEYPPPAGYKPLVDLLEWKHNAPVVITNGAKQALGASFYALKKLDRAAVTMRVPYWALVPSLLEMHGCISASTVLTPHYSDHEFWKHESQLMLAPNNPDGDIHSDRELIEISNGAKGVGMPLIHDAAYYTHSYLPGDRSLPQIGDVQVYSLSKMLGLSSLRVGYAVCPNPVFYKLIREYVEAMTVGVSLPAQIFSYELLNHMRGYPQLVEKFENRSYDALLESKKIIKTVDPEILKVPSNVEEIPGMFGWFKTGPKFSQEKAKVNFIDGTLFGMPGMVRMNLAFSKEKMQEIVNRLNSSKE